MLRFKKQLRFKKESPSEKKLLCRKVESATDWTQFIDLPWKIYEKDPNWVAPLKIAVKDLLDPKKNPFFKHAEIYPLLVEKDGEIVARGMGIIDHDHNRFHEEKAAMFGFFESINDVEVTQALLNEISQWAQSKGMISLRGPINLSTNNECGLLVEGFDDPPTVMMTYNPPYYADLFEKMGFKKAKDLYSYHLSVERKFSEVIFVHAERLKKKSGITIRPLRLKEFQQEVDRILDIYNDAWEKNWGFVPMGNEEFRHTAKDLKMIVDPDLVLIAEVNGQPVAFSVALPDVNQVFAKVPDGKLFPKGIFKLLWNLKGPGRKKTINRCRIVTLGIKQKYRELGLGPLFYAETYRRGTGKGYNQGEAGWVLEDNIQMNKALERMCGKRSKVYRIYERSF